MWWGCFCLVIPLLAAFILFIAHKYFETDPIAARFLYFLPLYVPITPLWDIIYRMFGTSPVLLPNEDMRGKVCIVTGANSGIGKETALGLACLGATVVLACRSKERGEDCLSQLSTKLSKSRNTHMFASQGSLILLPLDLADFSSVKNFVRDLLSKFPDGVDVLICSAGLNEKSGKRSGSSINITFHANFLGHFALCLLLLPKMRERAFRRNANLIPKYRSPARIVLVSSVMHHFSQRVNVRACCSSKSP